MLWNLQKKIKNKRNVLTTSKNFLYSAKSTFFYEMSLYMDMPLSELKKEYKEVSKYVFPLSQKFYVRFRRRLRRAYRNKRNVRVERYFIDNFRIIDMFRQIYRKIIIDYNLFFEHIFYETIVCIIDYKWRKNRIKLYSPSTSETYSRILRINKHV